MTTLTTDPRVPSAAVCMFLDVLEYRASTTPQSQFALFEGGDEWTFEETLREVKSTAKALKVLGVRKGDCIGVWLPNSADLIRVWFAINYLGAIFVPLNTAYRGTILEHCIKTANIKFLFLHPDLVPRLAEVNDLGLSDLLVLGGMPAVEIDGVKIHPEAASRAEFYDDIVRADTAPWDTQMIIYTSGTTGPSKAVLVSYLQLFTGSEASFKHTSSTDRFLANLPLFHVTGVAMIMRAILSGASFAMINSFKTREFWEVVKKTRSTSAILMGVMATFLIKCEPAAVEKTHGLKSVMIVPLSENSTAFSKRFNCDVYTAFAMSEISTPLLSGVNPQPLGTCGTPRDGVEVRLVDEHDCEVPRGEVGELIVRADRPWSFSHGYLGNAEATASAWRNGWFHTGDGFRQDIEGNFIFVDRIKDSIRRRGENISSFEVEAEICTHAAIKEAAVVAVPSELGEDEILAVISLVPDHELSPRDLIYYLVDRLPYFMVPRYVRILQELPKTHTLKVQKNLLRRDGLVPDVFDREAEGIRLKREDLKIG
ncbi:MULTISPECIES: AMP-binding protein [unclassified Pseudomonas]|uniref:AMP-binding protein n=1 Tax=unclassified Pseudomonas TaxID=196821 RepID=UPI00048A3F6D|nr:MULTISPECIES: AMP-binding protein [unclassified Pseudomonas]SMF65605.1 crotonobetaine/carnitine-CoA ligase [Pseudomonas sp. LAMO17WK12:I1]